MFAEYFAKANLLVLLSYSEGMPTIILEAMASEVPVITTNVSEIPEIIRHEETDMLVKTRRHKWLGQSDVNSFK